MSKILLSRVIMLPDTSVHIVFVDREAIGCTPDLLIKLLTDPLDLFSLKNTLECSTKLVNPKRVHLEDIKGLTLLKVYSDAETVCIFPKLFQSLFNNIKNSPSELIYLQEYIEGLDYSDEKHFLMKFYHHFTNELEAGIKIHRNLGTDQDVQTKIMQETFNTSFTAEIDEIDVVEITPSSSETQNLLARNYLSEDDTSLSIASLSNEEYVSIQEFALMNDVNYVTAQKWVKDKKIPGCYKDSSGKWRIPQNSLRPEDNRIKEKKVATVPSPSYISTRSSKEKIKGNDRETIQKKIAGEGLVSNELRKAIRSIEEYNFYKSSKYNYIEIQWEGRPVLIYDIDPDYCCKRIGQSNRERMKNGDPPIVPGTDEEYSKYKKTEEIPRFTIHHVGQTENSPFCVITPSIHQKFNGILHIKKSNEWNKNKQDLHGKDFVEQKKKFWKYYIEVYDLAGSFDEIPGRHLSVKKRKSR